MSTGPYTRTYPQPFSGVPIKIQRPDGTESDLSMSIDHYTADNVLNLINEAWRRGWRAGSASARAMLIESARVSAEPEESVR